MRHGGGWKVAVLVAACLAWQVPAFFLSFFFVLLLVGGENGRGWLQDAPSWSEALGALTLLAVPLAAGASMLVLLARWAVRDPYRRSTMVVTAFAALLLPVLGLLSTLG